MTLPASVSASMTTMPGPQTARNRRQLKEVGGVRASAVISEETLWERRSDAGQVYELPIGSKPRACKSEQFQNQGAAISRALSFETTQKIGCIRRPRPRHRLSYVVNSRPNVSPFSRPIATPL